MVVYSKKLTVNTKERIDFLRITDEVKKAVKESGVQDGIVLVNPMHITASIFINDNEKGLIEDFKIWFEKLAPKNFNSNHHKPGEDKGYSHLWRTILGREVVVSVQNFELELGPWEEIFYGEFDGKRNKKILIKVLGE
ncbi:YjbQ family protein [archaeon]|nr:YjbQ family protein [archaeon]